MDRFTARLPEALIERLHDTARRYMTTLAEISRRAAVYYGRVGGVVDLPDRQPTTRAASLPMEFILDPALGVDASNAAQVLELYLNDKDTGGTDPRYYLNPNARSA